MGALGDRTVNALHHIRYFSKGPVVGLDRLYPTICDQTELGVFLLRPEADGRVVVDDANLTAAHLVEHRQADLFGKATRDFLPREIADRLHAGVARCLAERSTLTYEETIELRDGPSSWRVTLIPVLGDEGAPRQVIGVARDLSDRFLAAQLRERRRIAEELRDTTGKHLAALRQALSVIAESARDHTLDSAWRATLVALDEATFSLEEANREIEAVSYLLHPPLLDSKGLGKALSLFATGFASRAGLRLDLEIDGAADALEEEIALTLFRVCQEGLNNIQKHAAATGVEVRLEVDPLAAVLTIHDNGKGFDEAGLGFDKPLGVGLSGMRERLARAGGTLRLDSRRGGTTLVACIPGHRLRTASLH